MNLRLSIRRIGGLLSFFGIALLPCAGWAEASASKPATVSAGSKVDWDLVIEDGKLLQPKTKGEAPDASLGNIIKVLREEFGPVNIVLSPGIEEIYIRDLRLRPFVWERALEAIRVASGERIRWSRTPVDLSAQPSQDDLLVVSRDPERGSGPDGRFEVFSLEGYLAEANDLQTEQKIGNLQSMVLETVEQVRTKSQSAEGPGFRYHSSAKLLVVTGDPETLQITTKLLGAVPGITWSQPVQAVGTTLPYGSGINPEVLRRYGLTSAAPSPGQAERDAQLRETFLRRYGITPPGSSGQTTQPVVTTPERR